MMIDDGAALSVAIETAVHAAPSITADMDPLFRVAGPVVSWPHAQSVTSAIRASVDDRFRMQNSYVIGHAPNRAITPAVTWVAPALYSFLFCYTRSWRRLLRQRAHNPASPPHRRHCPSPEAYARQATSISTASSTKRHGLRRR